MPMAPHSLLIVDSGKMMDFSFKNNEQQSSKGFTLLELSIVILLVGILTVPLLRLYEQQMDTKKTRTTKDNIKAAVDSVEVMGRYVCPSDRELPPTDPKYGVENCVMSTIKSCNDPSRSGICKFQTSLDRNGDGINDYIIIGGVPLAYYLSYNATAPVGNPARMFKLNSNNILDGWGNKLTYAVPELLSVPASRLDAFSDFKLGVIAAVDEWGNPTSGINNDGQAAIISHGKNGAGAYSNGGTRFPCPTGTREAENCNEDSIFMQSISIQEGNGANQYDDYVKFKTASGGDLWRNLMLDGKSTAHLINSNTQNVGINMNTTPTSKLDVNGTIRAATVRSDQICGPTPTDKCLRPDILNLMPYVANGTSTVTNGVSYCPAGQIVVEISEGQLKCGYIKFSAPVAAWGKSPACATGKYIRSILTNGCIICNDGVKSCGY